MMFSKRLASLKVVCILLCMQFVCGSYRIVFQNCKNPGWKCLNNTPQEVTFSCDAGNKTNVRYRIHVRDYFYNSIVSLSILNCQYLQLHFDCLMNKNPVHLRNLHINNCVQLEIPGTDGYLSRQMPNNISFENIGVIQNIPGNTFKDLDVDRCNNNQKHVNKILFKNVTIEQIDHNAFFYSNGINSLTFDNVTIKVMKEQAMNNVVMDSNGIFTLKNSKIDILRSNAIIVKSSRFLLTNNAIEELHPNALNITAENVIIKENSFKLIKPEAFGLISNDIEIKNNDFDLIKTSAFMNIRCADLTKAAQYRFSYNKIKNVEIGSLYFDRSTFEMPNKQISIEHNMIDCMCSRLAWLYYYPFLGDAFNAVTVLNDKMLNINNNNTCLGAPCYLPLNILKILIVNNICHLPVDSRLMCYLYYDKTINNISIEELRMNSNFKGQSDVNISKNYSLSLDEPKSNVTELAPAFYIIKPQSLSRHNSTNEYQRSRNSHKKPDEISLQDSDVYNSSSLTQQREIMDDHSLDIALYMKNYNISNVTIDKMLIINKKNMSSVVRKDKYDASTRINFQTSSKCYDKESCARYIQENKKRALEFYKYLYSHLRPDKFTPQTHA